MRWLLISLTGLLAATTVLVLGGCGNTVGGRAVSIYDDPFRVAGLPTTGGPNGPRTGIPDSDLRAENSDGGAADHVAMNAVADIQDYWRTNFPQQFPAGHFQEIDNLVSWDSKAKLAQAGTFCHESTYHLVNAAYCRLDNSIGWDRGVLLPMMAKSFGQMAVVMVLAHEYGHAVQVMARLGGNDTPVVVKEQQADCFAGSFMRHVATGKAKHFTINTSDGLNSVLAATVAIRDTDPDDPESVHGSAFERVTAVQMGFSDGPRACGKIDERDVAQRRGNLPQSFADDPGRGEYPITQGTLTELSKAMATVLPIPQQPTYSYHGAQVACATAPPTGLVSYCPDTNEIATDVPALAERGRSATDPDNPLPLKVAGDYNGYIVFISRYTLAVQHSEKQSLTGAKTGLRAACLSGVVTAELSRPGRSPQQGDITVAAGDLDEAVSGLLSDGAAASDITGHSVPSGFSRVDAFRVGVLQGRNACGTRYSG